MILDIFKYIDSKYNLLRIILVDLLLYYKAIQNYYIQYTFFLSYINSAYPDLITISKTRIKTFTIEKNKNNKFKKENKNFKINVFHNRSAKIETIEDKKNFLNLPPGTTLIIGLKNHYKYIAIKYIINAIINYKGSIYSYMMYLEGFILKLIKSMNDFRQFYLYSLNILFNIKDETISNIALDKFNIIKQNYALQYFKFQNAVNS